PTTWEEFQSVTAPALKDAGYVPAAQSHLPWIFTENFMSRHNLQFATNANGYEGVEGTELLVNNDALKTHFSNLVEWRENGLFEWYGAAWGDNQKPFENGDVAMWLGSSASFGGLAQTVDFEFSSVPLPYYASVVGDDAPGGYQSFIGGAALFAMSGKADEQNEAVAQFFEYLASADVQYLWHKETGYVPITNAAYDLAKSDGHYERTPAAETGITQLNLRAGDWTKGYRMGFYVQIRDVMNREYGKIFSGEATVDEAFQVIEEEGNQLLERFAKTAS
ncbi:MAG: extracellular solute-binding protein, partial [Pseudomonadota bacterium]